MVHDFPIRNSDIDEHGPTFGCAGCRAVVNGRGRDKHSPNCRLRIQELIKLTEEGRLRVERANLRKTEAVVRESERQKASEGEAGEVKEQVMQDEAPQEDVDVKDSQATGSGLTAEERENIPTDAAMEIGAGEPRARLQLRGPERALIMANYRPARHDVLVRGPELNRKLSRRGLLQSSESSTGRSVLPREP